MLPKYSCVRKPFNRNSAFAARIRFMRKGEGTFNFRFDIATYDKRKRTDLLLCERLRSLVFCSNRSLTATGPSGDALMVRRHSMDDMNC